jgi:hypothetical protein
VVGVDGVDEPVAAPASSFAPPAAAPAPAPAPKPAAKPRPVDAPLDMFVPPDTGDGELKLELAADEVERTARKRASTPVAVPVVDEPPLRRSEPAPAGRPSRCYRARASLGRSPAARGSLPASRSHCFGHSRARGRRSASA